MCKKRNGMSESEAGKIGSIISVKIMKEKKEKNIEEYLKQPKVCKKCGNIIPYEKRNNNFCCKTCSTSYNNSLRTIKESTKTKISNKLKKDKKIIICKQCGCEKGKCLHPDICSKYKVFKSLIKFGFDYNKIGTIDIYDEFFKIKNILENEYKNHIDDFTLKEKYGYKSGLSNFHKLLKSLGIEIKSAKERIKEAYFLGKKTISSNQNYKCFWHTTWERKRSLFKKFI